MARPRSFPQVLGPLHDVDLDEFRQRRRRAFFRTGDDPQTDGGDGAKASEGNWPLGPHDAGTDAQSLRSLDIAHEVIVLLDKADVRQLLGNAPNLAAGGHRRFSGEEDLRNILHRPAPVRTHHKQDGFVVRAEGRPGIFNQG